MIAKVVTSLTDLHLIGADRLNLLIYIHSFVTPKLLVAYLKIIDQLSITWTKIYLVLLVVI